MSYASEIIGRHKQKAIIQDFLIRKKSAFVAVIGRRRIGKTFLVDQTCKDNMCLRVTGIQNGDTDTQIMNFASRIAERAGTPIFSPVNNWQEAFNMLRNYLSTLNKRKKHVIFFDELPWIYTPRSGFIQHLAHFWNDYLSKEKNFVLVVCGSASSWIKKKIIHDRGGLHNRLDATIRLQPFTLSEVKLFLKSRNIKLTNNAIAEIYMTMGGVPYYLENINRGESHTQIVERMCFSQDGILNYEYENLYKSLFENAKNHEAIVSTLAKARSGLTRSEIIEKSGVDPGGPYTRSMEDLIVSGFIQEDRLFGRKKRGSVYRLVDEHTIFYHKFIKNNKSKSAGTWALISNSQKYKIWTGYAFENLCLRHQDEIKRALGIAMVYTEFSQYSSPGNNNEGFQIDIIIDRNDKIINLCECKYYNTPFKLTKKSANQLKKRAYLFKEKTGTKKQIFTTLLTNHPVIENEYYLDTVDNQINIDHLMN